MRRLRYEDKPIDAVDVRLLEVLASNARVSLADLSRRVGLSSPSVSERLKRLEESGIIRGYTVSIDPKGLGLPLAAWLRIRPIPGKLQQVAELIRTLSEVVECDRVTGDDCFLARVHVGSVEELEGVIDRIIPYAMTNTSIIQSSPVERRLPPVRRPPRT